MLMFPIYLLIKKAIFAIFHNRCFYKGKIQTAQMCLAALAVAQVK